jgi:hypothetical protein
MFFWHTGYVAPFRQSRFLGRVDEHDRTGLYETPGRNGTVLIVEYCCVRGFAGCLPLLACGGCRVRENTERKSE